MLSGEIEKMIAHNLPIVLRRLGDKSGFSESDLRPVRESAARVAAAGVPREVMLRVLSASVASMVESLWREAGLRDRAVMLGLIMHGLALAKVMTVTVSEAYEEHHRRAGRSQVVAAREALVLALLDGAPPETAARAGVALAESYAVVLLPLQQGAPPEPEADRIERCVRRLFPPGTLAAPGPHETALLVPVAAADGPFEHEPVRDLLHRLACELGRPLTGTAAWREDRGEVPAAVAEAREVMGVVRRLRRAPGLYVLDDVLLETALDRAPDLRRRLSAVLDPVAGNPRLSATIATYLEMEGDRRRTAASLHIHPTTLDYRLQQVAVRTTVSPTSLSGLLHLRVALAARTLDADQE